jgi:hypothetical protein
VRKYRDRVASHRPFADDYSGRLGLCTARLSRPCGIPTLQRRRLIAWIGFVTIGCAIAYAEAAPVRMKIPEGPAHGFVELSEASGAIIAHGESVQWLEKGIVVSRLVFRFGDGSLYDEVVRFSQKPNFRLVAYQLQQSGPSFHENSEVKFDRSGHYQARVHTERGAKEETASGFIEVPEDVTNGMISILLKNLDLGVSATTHLLAFTPQPQLLDVTMTPDGSDKYWIGWTSANATRYRVSLKVAGVKGVVATVIGKQPGNLLMWITRGESPTMVRFEGPMFIGGPIWHVVPGAPLWKP